MLTSVLAGTVSGPVAAKAASDCGAICGRAGVNVQGTPPGACTCAAARSQGTAEEPTRLTPATCGARTRRSHGRVGWVRRAAPAGRQRSLWAHRDRLQQHGARVRLDARRGEEPRGRTHCTRSGIGIERRRCRRPLPPPRAGHTYAPASTGAGGRVTRRRWCWCRHVVAGIQLRTQLQAPLWQRHAALDGRQLGRARCGWQKAGKAPASAGRLRLRLAIHGNGQ